MILVEEKNQYKINSLSSPPHVLPSTSPSSSPRILPLSPPSPSQPQSSLENTPPKKLKPPEPVVEDVVSGDA